MNKNITKLQNGSDIRGTAMTGVPGENIDLDQLETIAIGASFAYWLSFKKTKNAYDLKICIGHDPRLTSEKLTTALIKGMSYFGLKVYDAGLASTPAMFISTVMPVFEYDGAIMVTASHLPYNKNGFKFFTSEGGLDKEDIEWILDHASRITLPPQKPISEKVILMDMYCAHLRATISSHVHGNLKGLKVVVDAGNGSGGFFAEKVLAPLGADISGSQFLEPDGTFPNHVPNPENEDAMKSVSERVKEVGADIGIIFDTDVDRSAAVTASGEILSRNKIVALAAALDAKNHPNGIVVTDSVTSDELHDFLENVLHVQHLRYKRGYKNVINKACALNEEGKDAFLAIETSGHAAYSDNYYLDDGAYLAVKIIVATITLKRQNQKIEDLIDGLKSPAKSSEYRLALLPEDFSAVGDKILTDMKDWVNNTKNLDLAEPNYEGVRVNFQNDESKGWFLLRKSLHEPVMPLNIESSSEDGNAFAVKQLSCFFEKYDTLDISSLRA